MIMIDCRLRLRTLANTYFLVLIIIGLGSVVFAWPHDESDVFPDPNVKFGALENGFHYAILPNSEPPGKVSLRLHIDAGSFNEDEDERGLAHFMEHMVFNGSRNFDPGELIPIMQRLGIAFGSHVNAYTSFDETVYMLDLPSNEENVIDLCFNVMRDFADGALLDPEEIEKERGVILAEMSARDTVSARIFQQKLDFLIPGHLVTRRFPIGTKAAISSVTRDRFVDFYTNYYTPKRTTFVVVGDTDTELAEARISEWFANMTNPEDPDPDPDLTLTVNENASFRTVVFADDELSLNSLAIMTVIPFERKPDTEANRISKMPFSLANSIINSRFSTLVNQAGSPILSGATGSSEWFNALELGWFEITPADDRWDEVVFLLEQEFRRIHKYGFTQAEFQVAKATMLNRYETKVDSAGTRTSQQLATQLSNTVNEHSVFSTPEDDLRIVEKAFANMTLESLHEAFVTFWGRDDLSLVLTAKEAPENMTDVLASLYAASEAEAVTPPVDVQNVTFAYTDFGSEGNVTFDQSEPDLDIRKLILSNNVRVNMKATDFQENRILVKARFGTGRLGQPRNETGLDIFSQIVFNSGGLGEHSYDELKRIFAGRNVGVGLSIQDDAFVLSGATTPDDLELQLQLLAAYLTDSGYRDEGIRQFRDYVPAIIANNDHNIKGAFKKMDAWLKGNDGRFAVPTEDKLMSYEASDARDWIQLQLSGSYLEISLVGDLPDSTVSLIRRTVGALSMRASAIDTTNIFPSLDFPKTPDNRTFTYDSDIPQAASVVVWQIPPLTTNIDEVRQLDVLTKILTSRMFDKIREELGASYSPSARSSPSSSFDYGVLVAQSTVSPEEAEVVGAITLEIGKELAEEGATQDELVRALEPTLSRLEATLRSNDYWLHSVLDGCQAKPYLLDRARNRNETYAKLTLDIINDLSSKYLLPSNALRVELLPIDFIEGDISENSSTDSPTTFVPQDRFLRGLSS